MKNILTKAGKTHIEFFHDRNRNHRSLFFALMGKEVCDTREKIIQYAYRLGETDVPTD